LSKKKVLVSIPNEGTIHKHVCFVTDRLLLDPRYTVKIIRPQHRPYENNLHHIVNEFVNDGHDFWLNIDSDNPPYRNPLDLVELDLDVVGLPTPVIHIVEGNGERPVYENCYKYVEDKDAYTEWPEKNGLQRVDALGTGCVLYNKRVFADPEMRKAPFQRLFNEDGTVERGNDIAFSERARARGFLLFAHYNYRCMHFSTIEIHEVAQAFFNMEK
jgi:hypothetical protein